MAEINLKCPNCQAPVYSRKSGLCGRCGAVLPPGYKTTEKEFADERARAAQAERLASVFIGRAIRGGASDAPSIKGSKSRSAGTVDTELSELHGFPPTGPSSSMREVRRGVHLWAGVILGVLLVVALVFFHRSPRGIILPVCIVVALAVWHEVGVMMAPQPVCPKCRDNVTSCKVLYCYVCGSRRVTGTAMGAA